MDDSYWTAYVEKGNECFETGTFCCAIRHYQYALEEAEHLLQNSFNLKQDIPLIPIIVISYQNLINFFSRTHHMQKLQLVLNHFLGKMLFILTSKDFPLSIREVCYREIHQVYYTMIHYAMTHQELEVDLHSVLNQIKEARQTFLSYHHELSSSHS